MPLGIPQSPKDTNAIEALGVGGLLTFGRLFRLLSANVRGRHRYHRDRSIDKTVRSIIVYEKKKFEENDLNKTIYHTANPSPRIMVGKYRSWEHESRR